ncbi:MAG: hypothetical protein JWQ27_406 [Ferruginibacter sp.]|nr:hypothetical protein [Ferruginibacter sp.]
MMKKIFLSLVLIISFGAAFAQEFSEAYAETQRQNALAAYPENKWDSLRCAWYGECNTNVPPASFTSSCPLNKRMFGWHAIGTSSSSYQWSLLSDLSYFSYQVDPATGNATNASQITAMASNSTVVTALANGTRVNLTVTLFNTTNEFSTFFNSASAQSQLITNLIAAIQAANATGINIDFEGTGLSTTYLTAFTNFLNTLSSQLHSAIPGSELSIDLQGSAVTNAYMTALLPSIDLFILMGYDYYWGGQLYPGPVAPTYQFPKHPSDPNGHGSVSNDLNNMLKIVPANKALLAMPYYGRRWKTTNGCVIPASGNAASISTQTYTQYKQNTSGYYNSPIRETNTFNAYNCFTDVSAVANEQFMDDSFSLQRKYDIIKQRGLAGGAVWRLGYDAGYNDCWDLANNNLSNCYTAPPTDVLYDMGGPTGNYHNAEKYYFTVAPQDAATVTLTFETFDMEANWDSLWIYDGVDTFANKIGKFSGTALPAPVTAYSGAMTFKFYSDNATNRLGYKAVYTSTKRYYSVNSGSWSDPATWLPGTVPGPGDSVIIRAGHTVVANINATVKNININTGGKLQINDPAVSITVGDNSNKTKKMVNNGELEISAGNLIINGNLAVNAGASFTQSGGTLTIDANTGTAATSIADGIHLYNISPSVAAFNFSGGTLSIIDPPLGATSQAINCPLNFGAGSIVAFGNGVSTIASANTNGFGGDLLPAQIGQMILDAATTGNNRHFQNINPLKIKTNCTVLSGNLVQNGLLEIVN